MIFKNHFSKKWTKDPVGFEHNICFKKNKFQVGFELMTYRFAVRAQANCISLWNNTFGREKYNKI